MFRFTAIINFERKTELFIRYKVEAKCRLLPCFEGDLDIVGRDVKNAGSSLRIELELVNTVFWEVITHKL